MGEKVAQNSSTVPFEGVELCMARLPRKPTPNERKGQW